MLCYLAYKVRRLLLVGEQLLAKHLWSASERRQTSKKTRIQKRVILSMRSPYLILGSHGDDQRVIHTTVDIAKGARASIERTDSLLPGKRPATCGDSDSSYRILTELTANSGLEEQGEEY
jgi:CO dehydrogenase/acetyl-CoA synthase epsilon subunit